MYFQQLFFKRLHAISIGLFVTSGLMYGRKELLGYLYIEFLSLVLFTLLPMKLSVPNLFLDRLSKLRQVSVTK